MLLAQFQCIIINQSNTPLHFPWRHMLCFIYWEFNAQRSNKSRLPSKSKHISLFSAFEQAWVEQSHGKKSIIRFFQWRHLWFKTVHYTEKCEQHMKKMMKEINALNPDEILFFPLFENCLSLRVWLMDLRWKWQVANWPSWTALGEPNASAAQSISAAIILNMPSNHTWRQRNSYTALYWSVYEISRMSLSICWMTKQNLIAPRCHLPERAPFLPH